MSASVLKAGSAAALRARSVVGSNPWVRLCMVRGKRNRTSSSFFLEQACVSSRAYLPFGLVVSHQAPQERHPAPNARLNDEWVVSLDN